METERQRRFRHFRRDVRRQIQYYIALIPIQFIRLLPMNCALFFGRCIGILAYYLLAKERRRTVENMSRSLSGRLNKVEIEKYSRYCFINLGKSFCEVLKLNNMDRNLFFDRVRCKDENILQKSIKRKRGIILITGHIGNWEYLATWIAQRGYNLTVLARDNPVPAFDRLLTSIRHKSGYHPLNRGTVGAAKESLRVLRRGDILGLLIDQDTKVDGVFVDFFGRPAWTPVGAASLALKTGADVIVTYIIRDQDDRHQIFFSEPVVMEQTQDKKQDNYNLTALLTKKLEKIITDYPDHWVWMHRRWKTKPQ